MKHLIICSEYPPAARTGGIGTYVSHISHLLAEEGERVHVIAPHSISKSARIEEKLDGRLIIHRVSETSLESHLLSKSDFPRQSFAWEAGLYAEKLVREEGIDLIEAQEFQAPLYFFQIRRALGLGPGHNPPCLIHLHSPTKLTTRYNDRDPNHPSSQVAHRLESYSMLGADALLCPSRVLAARMESDLGLQEGTIEVIPLPIGNSGFVEREADVWKQGAICYVGRLERRKGILEWIDAAVAVASADEKARFEFVGANILEHGRMHQREVLHDRIPASLKTRFSFHDHAPHSRLLEILSRARIASVPSRWENFPNACIEAMASGLPVIATRNGGMAEMVADGKTGWLAEAADKMALADAIRRALATPPEKIMEMGRQASTAIRQLCENRKVLEKHLTFRRALVSKGSSTSLHLPPNLPHLARTILPPAGEAIAENRRGIATIITTGQDKNEAITGVLRKTPETAGFVFLRSSDRLATNSLALIESIFRRLPQVGVISFWVEVSGSIVANPCPTFPYQWVANDVVECSVFRTEALLQVGMFREEMISEFEYWDLANAIMAAGWIAVTVPALFCKRAGTREQLTGHGDFRMRSLLLARFPDLVQQDASDIIQLSTSQIVWLRQKLKNERISLRSASLKKIRNLLRKLRR